MNATLFDNITKELIDNSSVPVIIDGVRAINASAIVISRLKLVKIVEKYEFLYRLVNKCWSNLPPPPASEKTYLFAWMLASDGYSVNHGTIKWEGSSVNTFVHMWQIVDRMKPDFTAEKVDWLVGARSCSDYCTQVGTAGPVDALIYHSEDILPAEIEQLAHDLVEPWFLNEVSDYDSHQRFIGSVRVTEPMGTLTIGELRELVKKGRITLVKRT